MRGGGVASSAARLVAHPDLARELGLRVLVEARDHVLWRKAHPQPLVRLHSAAQGEGW